MRSSLNVAVLAVLCGCSPDEPPIEPPAVVVTPLPPTPLPATEIEQLNPIRGSSQSQVGVDRVARSEPTDESASLEDLVQQNPRRLVFECSDGVSFAVRMNSDRLALYAPGLPPNGFLTLVRLPSASGIHYRVGDTDFWSKGDVATLQIGRERYVDCVANPAAAVWQELERPDTTTR